MKERLAKLKRNRFFTILIVPEKDPKTNKVVLSSKLIKIFLILIGVMAVLLTLASVDYLYLKHKSFDNQRLVKENIKYRQQIFDLKAQMAKVDSTLSRLNTFAKKLKLIANVNEPEASNLPMGALTKKEELLVEQNQTPLAIESPDSYWKEELYSELSQMGDQLNELKVDASLQENILQELYEQLEDQKSLLVSRPAVFPCYGWLSSRYGYRVSPLTGKRQFHEGLDIAAPIGSPIYATADGVVTYVGYNEGLGKTIVIDHGYGFVTRYGHNSRNLVKIGEMVKRGQIIAQVGNTGWTTGSHVHYEIVVNNVPVDPEKYILD